MSTEPQVQQETSANRVDPERMRLISLDSYLLAKRVKSSHFAGYRAHAKSNKVATWQGWEQIFSDY